MRRSPKNNVVPMPMDATYFLQRALRCLNKKHYDKAIKYFRLATEKEPNDPVNYYHLAQLFGNLGRYEEAIDVLEYVLEEVDPDAVECLFHLGKYWIHAGNIELAENCLVRFLEFTESGSPYITEAEEILFTIAQELGRPIEGFREREYEPPYVREHEEAVVDLEQGDFVQALAMLKKIVEENPHFFAAYNNLATAYYHTGQLKEAIKVSEKLLAMDATNIHAICNLALFYKDAQKYSYSNELAKKLVKIYPINVHYIYKVALTLGILGYYEQAYHLFKKLLKTNNFNINFYYYIAVSAFNLGKFSEAFSYWQEAMDMDMDCVIVNFYMEQLEAWLSDPSEKEIPVIQYHRHLPFEQDHQTSEEMGWKSKRHKPTTNQEEPGQNSGQVIALCFERLAERPQEWRIAANELWEYTVSRKQELVERGKSAGWACALEYVVSIYQGEPDLQQELADRYGITVNTLIFRARKLFAYAKKIWGSHLE